MIRRALWPAGGYGTRPAPRRRGLPLEWRAIGRLRILDRGGRGFLTAVLAVGAVRALGRVGLGRRRRTSTRRCCASMFSTAAPYSVPHRQRLQLVVAVPGRRRRAWRRAAAGSRLAGRRGDRWARSGRSRRGSSAAALLAIVLVVIVAWAGRPAARPADDPRRRLRAGPRLLRGPDPGPRAVPVPVVRPGGDPARLLVALADRLRGRLDRDVPQHVRRPDRDVPRQPEHVRLAGHRRRPALVGGRDRGRPAEHGRLRLGGRPAPAAGRGRRSPPSSRTAAGRDGGTRDSRWSRSRRADAVAPNASPGAGLVGSGWPGMAPAGGAAAGAGVLAAAPRRRCRRGSTAPAGPSSVPSSGCARDLGDAAPPRSIGLLNRSPAAASTGWTCGSWSCSSCRRCAATYRVDEPARMHFDEVYHARTATEFLQDWRYGMTHSIYEWTHPHLAKYAMARGIMPFAGHDVAASSNLGSPVRDATIEPRRPDQSRPRREPAIGVDRGPARAHRLRPPDPQGGGLWPFAGACASPRRRRPQAVVGTGSGELLALDATAWTASGAADRSSSRPARVGRHARRADPRLAAFGDGGPAPRSCSATPHDRRPGIGHGDGSSVVAGATGMTDPGTGDAVVAAPADVADPSLVAERLATCGGDAAGSRHSCPRRTRPGRHRCSGGHDAPRSSTGGHRRRARRRDPARAEWRSPARRA